MNDLKDILWMLLFKRDPLLKKQQSILLSLVLWLGLALMLVGFLQ